MTIDIHLHHGDALDFDTEVLVVKYAQFPYGLDARITELLQEQGAFVPKPEAHEIALAPAPAELKASQVLFVGTPGVGRFDYAAVRDFSFRALEWLAIHEPETSRLALTLHGVGFGLDETEAFDSLLAGIVDAVQRRSYPGTLEEVTIVEKAKQRAGRLEERLRGHFPDGTIESYPGGDSERGVPVTRSAEFLGTTRGAPSFGVEITRSRSPVPVGDSLRRVGYDSAAKPHAFVAMPFSDEFEDTYHYGIARPIRDAGLLSERIDQAHFQGDIVQQILKKIRGAKLVVADLTAANPNVYLEVGFAWGCGVPTILLVRTADELRFDVQGRRCLIYGGSIRGLESKLRDELEALRPELGLGL